jgi:hypothetical protein
MKRRYCALAALTVAIVVAVPDLTRGYVLFDDRWPSGNVVMQLQLGSSSGTLMDGATSWGQSAEWALSTWNQYSDRVQFTVVRDSSTGIANGNRVNNVFWSSTVYGKDFGDRTLAITTHWLLGSRRTEADVVFNTAKTWNSYRGPLKRSSLGGSGQGNVYDFHRVALHEFGHVLGLDHPDDYGQNVLAQMNSTTSDLDRLAGDDISGAQALYSVAGNGTVAFPPRDEAMDFRNQLEAKYRDQLHRSPLATYVDIEGDIVWTSEYLRYRVNQCSHDSALFKVMSQIDGSGTLGVCGSAPRGQVNFPPRNEPMAFRQELESKYRDDLRRGPISTSVDNEGDIVWTQEYLRYRVNGCTHGDAVQRVFLQIDGRGIQPVCR